MGVEFSKSKKSKAEEPKDSPSVLDGDAVKNAMRTRGYYEIPSGTTVALFLLKDEDGEGGGQIPLAKPQKAELLFTQECSPHPIAFFGLHSSVRKQMFEERKEIASKSDANAKIVDVFGDTPLTESEEKTQEDLKERELMLSGGLREHDKSSTYRFLHEELGEDVLKEKGIDPNEMNRVIISTHISQLINPKE